MSGTRLSEDSLIARYFRPLAEGFSGAFGLGDDAAVIAPPQGMELVVTTDALIAGVHFFADDAPCDIAYKAVTVNISDLAAKAAAPLAYSLALALPRDTSEDWLKSFAEGLSDAQARFGIALSGGDTTVSPSGPLTIAITAFGCVPSGRMVRRGTARAGDSLYVSGTLGDAAFGLALRRGEPQTAGWPIGADERAWLIGRYLRAQPRLALRDALLMHASAAMDISDGLVIDCGRMCAASGADAVIEVEKVPLSAPASRLVASCPAQLETAITGGDDYEILCAVRQGEEAAFKRAADAAGVPVARLGVFTAGSGRLTMLGNGVPMALTRAGYDHFKR